MGRRSTFPSSYSHRRYGSNVSQSFAGTKQYMHVEVREGLIDNFRLAGGTMDDGDVVILSLTCGAPYVVQHDTSASAIPYGLSLQEVTATGVKDYEERGFYTRTAKTGDPVAVYICGGLLKHQNTALTGAAVSGCYGTLAYASSGTAGKIDASSTANGLVGIFVENADADGVVTIKSYL